jgi:RecA-family ATPase
MTAAEIIEHIDPSSLQYQEWLTVGMALKHEGASVEDWDAWSRRDSTRYKPGDCLRRWQGFNGSATPVTAGTLVELAKQQGWQPPRRESREFSWDDVISDDRDDLRIVDHGWLEDAEVNAPGDGWDPVKDITTYLSTLFAAEEYVGYVTEAYWDEKKQKWLPQKGSYSRTAGELISEFSRCGGDIGKVLGDYNQAAGAWIRFNPMDGKGINNVNVTSFRYALIESDTVEIEKQAAIYEALELPIAVLVHSGKRSLHAIVRVGATSAEEYRERVNYLHQVCKKNGLEVDTNNKNPSRLSRLPGVWRNGHKQYLVAVNQGKASFEEWKQHVEEANDNLPDIECFADVFANLPDLAPPLIDGVLREGHKMLLAGPSKAGKSFILLQLAMAIAEGREWLGWKCAQGKVLYVNLELDKSSCFHRLRALYQAHGWEPKSVGNIDIWNLRGKAVPMDALAPKLIRRALKKRYKAVIIDPIYKVITGDENAADKMAHFCNQFDRVCCELGSSVIYCHHHSKGAQGHKDSRDRSSGSGVFARDPDAIVDLIELNITKDRRKVIEDRAVCAAVTAWLDANRPNWASDVDQDTALVADKLVAAARDSFGLPTGIAEAARASVANVSGWRMEGTLREFPPFEARRFWFKHPIHVPDTDGLLTDAKADGEEAPWAAGTREKSRERKKGNKERLLLAYQAAAFDGEEVRIGDLAEAANLDDDTVRKWLRTQSELVLGKDKVIRTRKAVRDAEVEAAVTAARDLAGTVAIAAFAEAIGLKEAAARRRIAEHGKYEVRVGKVVPKEDTRDE